VGVRFPAAVRTGPGAHPAPSLVGNGGSSPGVKELRRDAEHLLPYSKEVKIYGATPPFPYTSSWHGD
jgi:hypothetical protein